MPANNLSLWGFTQQPQNRRFLAIGLCSILLQWIIFKLLYPFADYNSDSYSYINVASNHLAVSYRPLGYSYFLQAMHAIAHADLLVTTVQYAGLQLSILMFFFTWRLFFNPGKRTSLIVFITLLFNPVSLYVSNFIMSDALFAIISLQWFIQLCFIIQRPRWYQVIVQALLLLFAFEVRYSAMFYPLVTVAAFLLARRTWAFSISGIALSLVLLYGASWYTQQTTLKHTGTKTFSGFSGWQIANNAMHIYPYVTIDGNAMPGKECATVHEMVKTYFDTIGMANPGIGTATSEYMWMPPEINPLKAYMLRYMKEQKINDYLKGWIATGAIYNEYGKHLVKKHPVAFAKYYMLPNAQLYFISPLEMMSGYNLGQSQVGPLAVEWFGYKNNSVYTHVSGNTQRNFLYIFPYLLCLLNIAFIAMAGMVLFRWKLFKHTDILSIVLLATVYWIANFIFGIGTSPLNMRYQLLTMLLLTGITLFLLPQVWPIVRKHKQTNTP